jgi:hypothetical protein
MKKIASFSLLLGLWFLIIGPSPAGAIPGDINGDKQVDIADAVVALQIMNNSLQAADIGADINGDSRIGMAEVLYILQGLASQRELVLPTVFEIRVANGQVTLPAGAPVALTDLTELNS